MVEWTSPVYQTAESHWLRSVQDWKRTYTLSVTGQKYGGRKEVSQPCIKTYAIQLLCRNPEHITVLQCYNSVLWLSLCLSGQFCSWMLPVYPKYTFGSVNPGSNHFLTVVKQDRDHITQMIVLFHNWLWLSCSQLPKHLQRVWNCTRVRFKRTKRRICESILRPWPICIT